MIQVSSADIAPTLSLFGPEVLKLSNLETQLRLIVESNNQGAVQAKLGTVVLGTLPIRAGNNDLRFKLPPGVLRTLRRVASASNVLTLTPTSPNGSTDRPGRDAHRQRARAEGQAAPQVSSPS